MSDSYSYSLVVVVLSLVWFVFDTGNNVGAFVVFIVLASFSSSFEWIVGSSFIRSLVDVVVDVVVVVVVVVLTCCCCRIRFNDFPRCIIAIVLILVLILVFIVVV